MLVVRAVYAWFAAAWRAIYRATGAAALERRRNQRRAARDIAYFEEIRDSLPKHPGSDLSRAMLNEMIGKAAQRS